MIWYGAGSLLILHVYLWGWGLTLLILPRRWRRFWPAFCAPVGLALQSAVVWVGTHTGLPGTNSYARASLALPVALLIAAVAVNRPTGAWRLLAALRSWWLVAGIMACSLTLQAYPFTRPPHVLTSMAMTSCDAADYAAGARVFQEFSSADRTGYLGVVEPVRQLAVDNFYDFWLRINHFSPSALIALDCSLFGTRPFRLVTLMGVVLLTLQLPTVFWLARSTFRFGPWSSLAVTSLYGLSPALFYAVYQVALGQLIAAPAVALLTWAGVQAARGPATLRRHASYTGILISGNWLLLGSYNFFLAFAYVPVIAYVGLRTLIWGRWKQTLFWAGMLLANLLVCGALVPGRLVSMVQRFLLFNKSPFGWYIPGFYPSGWYGNFADVYLHPDSGRWSNVLAVLCLASLAIALVRLIQRRADRVLLAAACTLPIFFGYWLLLREEAHLHDNASYDAYKLLTVFYPGILVSLCLWLRAAAGAGRWAGLGAGTLWLILATVSVSGDLRFNNYLRRAPLRVDPPLRALSALEKLPEIESINVVQPISWDRLWSNYFLLRKPQYFPAPTYEGRPVTPPRARWDLDDRTRLVTVYHADEADPARPNARFRLIDRHDDRFLTADLGQGWYKPESFAAEHWVWCGNSAELWVQNPHPGNLSGTVTFRARALHDRTLRAWNGPQCLWQGTIGVSTAAYGVTVTFSPGVSVLRFDSPEPADQLPGDVRPLVFALYGARIDVANPAR